MIKLVASVLVWLMVALAGPGRPGLVEADESQRSAQPDPAMATEWPMWRHDAQRSAAAAENLPEELHVQWARDLPPAIPAWPNEPRLGFDTSYEPVAAAGLVLVGSPNNGSITAWDIRNGAERWRYFSDGPVRFAPVVWKGNVLFGSDDGYLYCLDIQDGGLRWRVQGAPDELPDRRHLGNGRLVSFWPVRGGPVLADGVVYFSAGLWPTMGVYVLAADAQSGRILWRNGDVGFIENVRIDHNELAPSGLSPQGYLVVQGDTLLVPNGRSMPAGLDRKTGKLLYYCQGYRNGDCHVTAMGRYAFVGRSGVIDVRTGREIGSRWAAAGKEAPSAFHLKRADLFEGPVLAYKLFPGCSAWSALAQDIAYDFAAGSFSAYDLAESKLSEYQTEYQGHAFRPWRWDPPLLWSVATQPGAPRPTAGKANPASLIRSGNRLYAHASDALWALDLTAKADGAPKLAWKQPVEGTPGTVLAAGGRLVVVTKEGRITCYGAEKIAPTTCPSSVVSRPRVDDRWVQTTADILRQTNVTEGYCLVLGVGTGRLVDELLGQSRLKIIGVDPDRKKIDRLRQGLIDAGLYGSRVELFVGKPFDFGLPPYLASLVVSEDCRQAGFSTDLPAAAILDVLRPYGGVLCLDVPADEQQAFQSWASGGLENASVAGAGPFALVRRSGPLPGAAFWTHECADAARSYFSRDERVKPPLGILWYGDGDGYGFWKDKDYGVGVKPQVVAGRVFALQLRTPSRSRSGGAQPQWPGNTGAAGGSAAGTNTLYAYDAYTGRVLWTTSVDEFTRYASLEDGIYVAGTNHSTVYDPATGRTKASYPFEAEPGQKSFVSDIRVSDEVIVIATAPEKVRNIEQGLWDSTTLVALDRRTGEQLWRRKAEHRFNNHALALGAGMVFATDSPAPGDLDKSKRHGEEPPSIASTILAIDARTGRTSWSQINRAAPTSMNSWLAMRGKDDWLAYSSEGNLLLTGKQQNARAYDATRGKLVWEQRCGDQPLILRGATFLNQAGQVFDLHTGKPLGPPARIDRGGCNYAVAGQHLLLVRDHSASYTDFESGQQQCLYAIRSGCSNSLIAADGILNVPNFAVSCVCNYPMQTAFAMVHMPADSRSPRRSR